MSSSTVEAREALATHVELSEDTLSVGLADGRTIAAPLAWYPRLAHATAGERDSWRLIGGGRGIHGPAAFQYARANTTRPSEGFPVTMHCPASFARSNGMQRIVAFVSS
jgi:hypothetical protein